MSKLEVLDARLMIRKASISGVEDIRLWLCASSGTYHYPTTGGSFSRRLATIRVTEHGPGSLHQPAIDNDGLVIPLLLQFSSKAVY